jgi:hypothetical protein
MVYPPHLFPACRVGEKIKGHYIFLNAICVHSTVLWNSVNHLKLLGHTSAKFGENKNENYCFIMFRIWKQKNVEVFALLGYYAVYISSCLATFRDSLSVPYLRVDWFTFEYGTAYSETSLNSDQYTLFATSPKNEYFSCTGAEAWHFANDCPFRLRVKNVRSATHILYDTICKFYFTVRTFQYFWSRYLLPFLLIT